MLIEWTNYGRGIGALSLKGSNEGVLVYGRLIID
jgi:hypothetical protein